MFQTPAIKRAARVFAASVLLAGLAGCRTHPNIPAREPPRATDGELAQARALAHYAVGFMLLSDAVARREPPPRAAVEAFLAAHQLDPASAGPVEAAAKLLASGGRAEEVLELLTRHARHASAPAHAWYQLGLCAEFFRKSELAVDAYERALKHTAHEECQRHEARPPNVRIPIITALVRSNMTLGRDRQAIKILKREAAVPTQRSAMRAIAGAWARKLENSGETSRAQKMAGLAASFVK